MSSNDFDQDTDYDDFVSQEQEDRDYEAGAELGDPRRCPKHPDVKTSSPDGMFDAPCGKCEFEMDQDSDEPGPANLDTTTNNDAVSGADLANFLFGPGPDDDIPF